MRICNYAFAYYTVETKVYGVAELVLRAEEFIEEAKINRKQKHRSLCGVSIQDQSSKTILPVYRESKTTPNCPRS